MTAGVHKKAPDLLGICCLLCVLWVLAGPSAATELELSLEWIDGCVPREGATPTAFVMAPDEAAIEPRALPLDPLAPTVLDLEPGVDWRIRVEAAGCWSEERTVRLGRVGAATIWRLWPTATLTGRVTTASDQLPPDLLTIRLTKTPEQETEEPITVAASCPVEAGVWQCEVPAGFFDAAFSIDGYTPLRRWQLSIPRNGVRRLEDLQFLPGGAMTGLVTTIDGGAPPHDIQMILTRPPPKGAEDEDSAPLFYTFTTDGGFFQFSGVPEGSYLVKIADTGFFPAASEKMDVETATEEFLREPLVLQTVAALELIFNPSVDPHGQPWRFNLTLTSSRTSAHSPGAGRRGTGRRTGHGKSNTLAGIADAAGVWSNEHVATGLYNLTVQGAFPANWAAVRFAVDVDQPPVEIEVPIVAITGQAWMGPTPLPAQLKFTARGRKGSVDFKSDYAGDFRGYLPSSGLWNVAVRASLDGTPLTHKTEVEVPLGQQVADVEILVPFSSISGRVLDERGEPLRGATVTIRWLDSRKTMKLKVDKQGRFGKHGLQPGNVAIRASARGTMAAPWLHTRIEAGREPSPLELRLQRSPGAGRRTPNAGRPTSGARRRTGG